jgi:hypothetical protein
MKPHVVGSHALMMLGLALASASTTKAAGKVRVCVSFSTYTTPFVLNRAEAITSRMFATVDVALEWHSAGGAACLESQQTQTVVIDFATNTPPKQHPGALAYAQVYEAVHIVVFYDRIEKSADGATQASTFLAHVMTHEITHLLQGLSRHSQTGLMKAHWDAHDFLQMAHAPLPFAPEDIDLIQYGLRNRGARADSAVPLATTVALQ